MKNLIFLPFILVTLLIFSCERASEYDRLVKRELNKGVRHDSLFLGYYLGMERQDFFDHSWQLNQQGVVTGGFRVEYDLNELPHAAFLHETAPLNTDRIGHRYPPYRYEVSREKVREYAMATGVADPQYQADAGDLVAPPTFAACFTVGRGSAPIVADPELGAHWTLVHGAQEYDFHRPVRVGDVLECTPSIADISYRGTNEFLTIQIDCVDAKTGEPVVTSRGTIIFLGAIGLMLATVLYQRRRERLLPGSG
jgi:hypothetical protein